VNKSEHQHEIQAGFPGKQSKAKQSKAKQSKAKQSKAKQSLRLLPSLRVSKKWHQ
jgi:hypothetical protein